MPPLGVVERQNTNMFAVKDLLVAQALSFIWTHFREVIRARDVAEHLSVPLRSLQAAFRTNLGRGIQDEIVGRRIKEAKRLLLRTDLTVSQIADELGFSTPEYLFRLFHQKTGMTARQYRLSTARVRSPRGGSSGLEAAPLLPPAQVVVPRSATSQ